MSSLDELTALCEEATATDFQALVVSDFHVRMARAMGRAGFSFKQARYVLSWWDFPTDKIKIVGAWTEGYKELRPYAPL